MKALFLCAAAAAALLTACTIREARIAVPSDLAASSERLELRGMGGGRRGSFDLAGARGTFSRSADRLGILDPLIVRHSGGGSFEIEGASSVPPLGGRCGYREGRIDLGPISVTPRRLAFHCAFGRAGEPIAASLILEDPDAPLGSPDGRARRTGTLYFEGRRIEIRSIHRDAGGGLPLPTPLGYAFSAGGRQIGAVDLNGANKTILAPLSGPERDAVLAAAVALSIFWDPAEVQSAP